MNVGLSISAPTEFKSCVRIMSSDDDIEEIPDAKTAQELVEQFVEITSTNSALAQSYLQDGKWSVEASINAYYKDLQKELNENHTNDKNIVTIDLSENNSSSSSNVKAATFKFNNTKSMVECEETKSKSDAPLKMITWNIDGLDSRNIDTRIREVIAIIKSESPDIVHLQEVTPETLPCLKNKLMNYKFLLPVVDGLTGGSYFVSTLLKISSIDYVGHDVINFPGSVMCRNILRVQADFKGVKLCLMNTHLESTRDHSEQRMVQLKIAFDEMNNSNVDTVFAGDLNLRDREVTNVGGLPVEVQDLWISCGSREECKYTWDASRNVNIGLPGKYRCRFDRVYFKPGETRLLTPIQFNLIGINKVKQSQCYPSDHWGIMCSLHLPPPPPPHQ